MSQANAEFDIIFAGGSSYCEILSVQSHDALRALQVAPQHA